MKISREYPRVLTSLRYCLSRLDFSLRRARYLNSRFFASFFFFCHTLKNYSNFFEKRREYAEDFYFHIYFIKKAYTVVFRSFSFLNHNFFFLIFVFLYNWLKFLLNKFFLHFSTFKKKEKIRSEVNFVKKSKGKQREKNFCENFF